MSESLGKAACGELMEGCYGEEAAGTDWSNRIASKTDTKSGRNPSLGSVKSSPPQTFSKRQSLHTSPRRVSIAAMDRISSHIARFKQSCPYLAHTKAKTLRHLATSTHTRYPSISRLTYKATKCPIMGPALVVRSHDMMVPTTAGGSHSQQHYHHTSAIDHEHHVGTKKGYASLAGKKELDALHKTQGVDTSASTATAAPAGGFCPHNLTADAKTLAGGKLAEGKSNPASSGGACPVTGATQAASTPAPAPGTFDYAQFYDGELDKKHADKSYRYFNNINRLAAKFPVAHTGKTNEEVDVWCSNDYLGMGRNPAVLDTMQ